MAIKEKHLSTVSKSIEDSVRDPNLKRSLQFIKEKGSGCWLTALPLKRFGYSLNKIEFRDAYSCVMVGRSLTPHFTVLVEREIM